MPCQARENYNFSLLGASKATTRALYHFCLPLLVPEEYGENGGNLKMTHNPRRCVKGSWVCLVWQREG